MWLLSHAKHIVKRRRPRSEDLSADREHPGHGRSCTQNKSFGINGAEAGNLHGPFRLVDLRAVLSGNRRNVEFVSFLLAAPDLRSDHLQRRNRCDAADTLPTAGVEDFGDG
jgi:hypothetical protein